MRAKYPQLAAAARAFAPFLDQLATEVSKWCNEFDGGLIRTAETVCRETDEDADGWPIVHIQSAMRAARRASQEAGWALVIGSPLTDAADDAWFNALKLLGDAVEAAWKAFCDHSETGYPDTVEGAVQCQHDQDRLRDIHRGVQACMNSLLDCVNVAYDWRAAFAREEEAAAQ